MEFNQIDILVWREITHGHKPGLKILLYFCPSQVKPKFQLSSAQHDLFASRRHDSFFSGNFSARFEREGNL